MTHEEEFEAFLEHVGVKGMKWGVRTVNAARATGRGTSVVVRGAGRGTVAVARGTSRTSKRAVRKANRVAGLTAVGAIGATAGLALVNPSFRKFIGPQMRIPFKAIVVGGASVAAVTATRKLLDEKGHTKVSDIRFPSYPPDEE